MDNTIKPGDPVQHTSERPPKDPIQTTPEREFLMQFFAYKHLPPALQAVSMPFATLAEVMIETLPRNPERTVMLRKLLESKDCAVRAMLAGS